MRIALIPARGGSKRLPRKNILPFAGKPMIGWTIEAAIESKLFDEVLVSTEDEEIAKISESLGASTVDRPEQLADDRSTIMDVVHDTLEQRSDCKEMSVLLANCPLRPASEIQRSFHEWKNNPSPALLSVVDYLWTPPFRAQAMDEKNNLQHLMPEWSQQKSQEYPEAWCLTGAIYWSTAEVLQKNPSLYVEGIAGFPIPWHYGVDIDTANDFRLAEGLRFAMDRGFKFEAGDES